MFSSAVKKLYTVYQKGSVFLKNRISVVPQVSPVDRQCIYSKTYELGLNIPKRMHSFPPHMHYHYSPLYTHQQLLKEHIPGKPSFAKEKIDVDLHFLTHIDAFNHCAEDLKSFKGSPLQGSSAYGADKIPLIQGVGILLDIPSMMLVERLEPGFEITMEVIERCLQYQQSRLTDDISVILIRTGHIYYRKEEKYHKYYQSEPGITLEAASCLRKKNIIAIGSDNFGVEVVPCRNAWTPENVNGDFYPVHRFLLIQEGVYLIENLDLDELSRNKVYRFLFIAAPIRFEEATAAFVNPIAMIKQEKYHAVRL